MRFGRQTYYWVSGTTPEGKTAVAGPFTSESTATDETGDLRGKRLFRLATSNMARAKQMIKAKGLAKTGDSSRSLKAMFGRKQEPVSPPQKYGGSMFSQEDMDDEGDR